MTLEKGKKYDVGTLVFTGWTEGDGTGAVGYNVADFFGADGAYRGADGHGIEPTFGEDPGMAAQNARRIFREAVLTAMDEWLANDHARADRGRVTEEN